MNHEQNFPSDSPLRRCAASHGLLPSSRPGLGPGRLRRRRLGRAAGVVAQQPSAEGGEVEVGTGELWGEVGDGEHLGFMDVLVDGSTGDNMIYIFSL